MVRIMQYQDTTVSLDLDTCPQEIAAPGSGLQALWYDTRRLPENREATAEKPFWSDFPIIFVK